MKGHLLRGGTLPARSECALAGRKVSYPLPFPGIVSQRFYFETVPDKITLCKSLSGKVLCQARSSDLCSDKEAEAGEFLEFVDAG